MAEAIQQDVAQVATAALREGLGDRLVAVVLFGSRARVEAREDSDWDLLVIARELPERVLERHEYMRRILPNIYHPISIIANTPEEFESHVASLYLDIALDGMIVYDTEDYIASRLDLLRRMIQEASLVRLRLPEGDLWYRAKPGSYQPLTWPAKEPVDAA